MSDWREPVIQKLEEIVQMVSVRSELIARDAVDALTLVSDMLSLNQRFRIVVNQRAVTREVEVHKTRCSEWSSQCADKTCPGWVMKMDTKKGLLLERCDICRRFADDSTAVRHIFACMPCYARSHEEREERATLQLPSP